MQPAVGIGERDRLERPDVHGREDTALPLLSPK
jgi:hypothetical protein